MTCSPGELTITGTLWRRSGWRSWLSVSGLSFMRKPVSTGAASARRRP
jgi:hypothetical protein